GVVDAGRAVQAIVRQVAPPAGLRRQWHARGVRRHARDLPPRQQLARIRRTGRDIERLITLVLVLAKDPMRLARAGDRVALDELLVDIVDEHRPMALQKGLVLDLEPSPRCDIHAPLPVVQAAIANLLRNAIENSDSGAIAIRLQADGAVVIGDPGHGMTPEQISAIYARMARGGGREGGGIGLDLIARLCEHLGWRLEMTSHPGAGTTARLEFNAHAAAPPA
ncbi:MAG TPA: HAMP domain-containing sensor histidine kinase, partial [Luteimonas sp.]|nr:HAMP domain-containing sensor histidine kinase [Luteimonas sp.]